MLLTTDRARETISRRKTSSLAEEIGAVTESTAARDLEAVALLLLPLLPPFPGTRAHEMLIRARGPVPALLRRTHRRIGVDRCAMTSRDNLQPCHSHRPPM